jgi:hypothetical protein
MVGAAILALRWIRYGASAVRPRTQIDDAGEPKAPGTFGSPGS